MNMRVQSRKGFTVLEILVVIAIIATLAGISAPLIIRPINKGKDARALQQMRSIETALFDYQDDHHGIYPLRNGFTINSTATIPDDMFTTASAQGIYVIGVLHGAIGQDIGGSALDNRDGKVYLTVKETTLEAGDGVITATVTSPSGTFPSGTLLDPWSRPYHVIIDGDKDEKVEVGPILAQFNTELEDKIISERVVLFLSLIHI